METLFFTVIAFFLFMSLFYYFFLKKRKEFLKIKKRKIIQERQKQEFNSFLKSKNLSFKQAITQAENLEDEIIQKKLEKVLKKKLEVKNKQDILI